jgi:hypothetical protein
MTVVSFVAGFCVLAAAACLICAIVFAFADRRAAAKVRDAAQSVSEAITETMAAREGSAERPRTPVQMQSAGVDFGGVAKLAEALEKLNPSGRFLIGSVIFAATAALVAGVGSATGH